MHTHVYSNWEKSDAIKSKMMTFSTRSRIYMKTKHKPKLAQVNEKNQLKLTEIHLISLQPNLTVCRNSVIVVWISSNNMFHDK